ncbi:hypothetical protein DICVIV_00123 [Dictyocaulus viviparus]|uniref:UBX domain-containing protein n=1 Tax=Dictyocaulus viviparus TaxID=29172 RepID=A0A0D8YCD0_DICVI|nr:hypothetical protein DICVIV_00123 [Dictyocaulus viviparus]
MFPTLHSSSTTTKEQRISPSSSTSFRPHQPPRAPSFVPLKFPEIPKKSKDSKGDVIRFRSDYANKFAIGSRHTVDFFSGSFDEAQKEAKNSIRLILVFIHDPTNEDSAKFIHESLNSVEFGELVSRNQLIVWGVANDSDEGKYVAFYQHVFKFPFLGLMCPRGDGRFFTARRTSGFITAIDLIEKLQKSCDVLQSELKELRKQKEIIMENRRIMEEQEKAYKESAERDKQKILKAKKAREEKLEAEKKQQEKQKQMEQRRQMIAEKRGELKLQVEQQPTGNELVNVQVRFPSGKKFSKKFSLDDSLEKLFIAIFCYETCPDFFTVATGFPRSEIHCAPEWYHALLSAQLTSDGLVAKPFRQASSFRAAGLGRAVGVFVNNHGTNSDSY